MAATLSELQKRLEALLEKRDTELIADYSGYRSLLREIAATLDLDGTVLPLFPEREHGADLRRRLYEAQGLHYGARAKPKALRDEVWTPCHATVVSLAIDQPPPLLIFRIRYQYSDPKGGLNKGSRDFEQDGMHAQPWHWNETEVRALFSPGATLACLVSDSHPSRHKIFMPF